jgi:hypothetical protein
MPQWEYLTVAIHLTPKGDPTQKVTKRLNEYGRKGWELVGFEWDGKLNLLAIFKRPAKDGGSD